MRLAAAQAMYGSSFQLTHMKHGNHAQAITSNGGQKEDRKFLQRSQLCQHGEFRHVSIREWQRSPLHGQNLCGPFAPRQGVFQHQNCMLGSLRCRPLLRWLFTLFMQHNISPTRSVVLYHRAQLYATKSETCISWSDCIGSAKLTKDSCCLTLLSGMQLTFNVWANTSSYSITSSQHDILIPPSYCIFFLVSLFRKCWTHGR